MVAPQVFRVLTEFTFETGRAQIATGDLATAVDQVSNAADRALVSFQKLSIGIVSSYLSGPGGGVLGVLGSAISANESFINSQIGIANVLGREAGDFSTRMAFAEKSLIKINKLAKDFGLPGKDLANITKTLTPVLRQKLAPKVAFDQSLELGRFFLKAAPTLNVDPGDALGQLQRAVLGFASQGDTLFRILTADTKAMAKFVGKSKDFNNLKTSERVALITKAFKEFGDDAKVLEALTNTVSGQFRILKETLSGMGSILRPLGQIISRVVVQALKALNESLDTTFRTVFQNLAFGLEPFTRSAEDLIATALQLRQLRGDLNLANTIFIVGIAIQGLAGLITFLKIRSNFATSAILGLSKAIDLVGGTAVNAALAKRTGLVGGISSFLLGPSKGFLGFLNKATIFLSRLILPLGVFIFFFQLLSRATARFKINQASKVAKLLEKISKLFAGVARFAGILTEAFNELAEKLAISFVADFIFAVINSFVDGLQFVLELVVGMLGTIQGIVNSIGLAIAKVANLIPGLGGEDKFFAKKSFGEVFKEGQQGIFDKVFSKEDPNAAFLNQVNNFNGPINQKFDFKERIEPDRVAFTVKEQLMKAAQNATSAKNRPFSPSTAGGG